MLQNEKKIIDVLPPPQIEHSVVRNLIVCIISISQIYSLLVILTYNFNTLRCIKKISFRVKFEWYYI